MACTNQPQLIHSLHIPHMQFCYMHVFLCVLVISSQTHEKAHELHMYMYMFLCIYTSRCQIYNIRISFMHIYYLPLYLLLCIYTVVSFTLTPNHAKTKIYTPLWISMDILSLICDCLSKNLPSLHLPVFREILFWKFNVKKSACLGIGLVHWA